MKLAESDIAVQILLPSGMYEMITVNLESTVLQLKQLIKTKTSVPVAEQFLYFNQDRLQDEVTLGFYGILESSTIRLLKKKLKWKANNIKISNDQQAFRDTKSRKKETCKISHVSPKQRWKRAYHVILMLQRADRHQYKKTCRAVFHHLEGDKDETMDHKMEVNMKLGIDRYNKIVSAAIEAASKQSTPKRLQDIARIGTWMRSVNKFSDTSIPKSVLYNVCRKMYVKNLNPGEYVFQQGALGTEFYIVMSGKVSLAIAGYGKIASLVEGSVFGEIAVINDGNGSKRTATAIVDFGPKSTTLAVIPSCTEARVLLSHLDEIMNTKIKFLNSIPYFYDLPQSSLIRLAYVAQIQDLPGKTRILTQGDEATHIYILMAGQVTMSKSGPAADPRLKDHVVIDLIEPPQVFGEECCIFPKPPYSCSIESVTNCKILQLPVLEINHLISPYQRSVEGIVKAARHRTIRHDYRLGLARTYAAHPFPQDRRRSVDIRREAVLGALGHPVESPKRGSTASAQSRPGQSTTMLKQHKSIGSSGKKKVDTFDRKEAPLMIFPNSGVQVDAPRPKTTGMRTSFVSRMQKHKTPSPRMKRIHVLSKLRECQSQRRGRTDSYFQAAFPWTHMYIKEKD